MDGQAPRPGRWARDEVRGRYCQACDLRTTHARGVCLRCERLGRTRRLGLYLTLAGAAVVAAGLAVLLLRGLDPSLPPPLEPGVILVALGVLAVWPGLYGLLFRRWPDLSDDDYAS